MKKITKIRSYGISIAFLLISIITMSGISVEPGNLENYLKKDSRSTANFIDKNFEKFARKYNENTGDNWQATSIEKKFPITVHDGDDESEGFFLDFNEKNGYAIVGNDYNLLDFEIRGSSPFEGISSESHHFSKSAGYFYKNQSGEIISINSKNNTSSNAIYEDIKKKHYDGQEENARGCGMIVNTDDYIYSKYGSGWKLGLNNTLDMDGFIQPELSCYTTNKHIDDSIHGLSEGNCWMVSAYNVLQYMQKHKWTKMPSAHDKVDFIPRNDERRTYLTYFDENGNNKSKKLYYKDGSFASYKYTLSNEIFKFPKLYTEVRKFVSERYARVDGGSIFRTSKIIENIAYKYGYNVNAKEHIFWGLYADKGVKKIDSGYPLLWSTSSGTYGSHTMAVCGYKYYYKTCGWWIFKYTKFKLFYELRDGHSENARYYDISGHIGFSAIISLEE